MPVFAPRMLDQLLTSLKSLSDALYQRTPLILTGDEFISAFIDPDHVAKLKEVQALVGFSGHTSLETILANSAGQQFSVVTYFTVGSPVVLPQYTAKGLQPSVSEAVLAKISSWMDERTRFGEAFGDAYDALYNLNTSCGDAASMALVLPCLPTLMGRLSDDTQNSSVKKARKLSDVKSFGKLPKLPVRVKQRLLEISAIINSVTLMTDAQLPETDRGDAKITVRRPMQSVRASIFYGDAGPNTPVPAATFI